MALVLLVAAGLMLQSVNNLQRTALGFEPDGLVTFPLSLPRAHTTSAVDAVSSLATAERVAALPGVQATALGLCAPVSGGCNGTRATFPGKQPVAPGAGAEHRHPLGVARPLQDDGGATGAGPGVHGPRSRRPAEGRRDQRNGRADAVWRRGSDRPESASARAAFTTAPKSSASSATCGTAPSNRSRRRTPTFRSCSRARQRHSLRAVDARSGGAHPRRPRRDPHARSRPAGHQRQNHGHEVRRCDVAHAPQRGLARPLRRPGPAARRASASTASSRYRSRSAPREIGVRMALGAEPAQHLRAGDHPRARHRRVGIAIGLGLSLLSMRFLEHAALSGQAQRPDHARHPGGRPAGRRASSRATSPPAAPRASTRGPACAPTERRGHSTGTLNRDSHRGQSTVTVPAEMAVSA